MRNVPCHPSLPPLRVRHSATTPGFTLVELITATAVLTILLLVLASIAGQVQKTYRNTAGKVQQFRAAQDAFEAMTRRLSTATLNTYWDYDSPTNPTRYQRTSELRFKIDYADDTAIVPDGSGNGHAIFFQAPGGFTNNPSTYAGMQSLLNTFGYYVAYESDQNLRPSNLPSSVPYRYRYRLYEMIEPSDVSTIYTEINSNGAAWTGTTWYESPLAATDRSSYPLADNIIALIILPLDPDRAVLSDDYKYDSTPGANPSSPEHENQLPPYLQVTMVAIDETSAQRLAAEFGTAIPDFFEQSWFSGEATLENYEQDLETLKTELDTRRLNYRVFTTNIGIRGAKWSRD